jgi:hypothetical protein
MPKPRRVKISSEGTVGSVSANPIADPMKGAVQGLAMRVARTPLKKEVPRPFF